MHINHRMIVDVWLKEGRAHLRFAFTVFSSMSGVKRTRSSSTSHACMDAFCVGGIASLLRQTDKKQAINQSAKQPANKQWIERPTNQPNSFGVVH